MTNQPKPLQESLTNIGKAVEASNQGLEKWAAKTAQAMGVAAIGFFNSPQFKAICALLPKEPIEAVTRPIRFL